MIVRYALQIQMHKALILFILNNKCGVKHYELDLFIFEYTIKSYPAVCGFIAQYVFLFQYSDCNEFLSFLKSEDCFFSLR